MYELVRQEGLRVDFLVVTIDHRDHVGARVVVRADPIDLKLDLRRRQALGGFRKTANEPKAATERILARQVVEAHSLTYFGRMLFDGDRSNLGALETARVEPRRHRVVDRSLTIAVGNVARELIRKSSRGSVTATARQCEQRRDPDCESDARRTRFLAKQN